MLGIRYTFFIGAGLLVLASLTTFCGTREVVGRREGGVSVLDGLRASFSRKDLSMLFLVMFATQTALMAVQPTLPLLVRSLAQHQAKREVALAAGVIFSLTGLSTALGAPLVGRVKRWNHCQVLGMGLVAAGILHGLQGITNRIELLGLERFLFGFANASILVSGNILIAQSAPEDKRGQVFGVLNSVASLGSILGPILGGYAAGKFGIPSSFYLSSLLFLMSIFLVMPVFRAVQRGHKVEIG